MSVPATPENEKESTYWVALVGRLLRHGPKAEGQPGRRYLLRATKQAWYPQELAAAVACLSRER